MATVPADAFTVRAALTRIVEAGAARRRERVAAALGDLGVAAVIEGNVVRVSGRGLVARWWRELGLREAGRDGL